MTTDEPPVVIPRYADWITPTEVANNLGVKLVKVLAWITRGRRINRQRVRLRAVKLGHCWRVDPSAVGPFVRLVEANDQVGFVAFMRSDGRPLNAGTGPIKHLVHP